MVQVLPNSYFRANFLTMRPNTANDMELESLNKCEFFCYVLFLTILYGFKSVFENGEKRIFAVISMNFIGIGQIIHR